MRSVLAISITRGEGKLGPAVLATASPAELEASNGLVALEISEQEPMAVARVFASAMVVALAAALLAACSEDKQASVQAPPAAAPKVTVSRPIKRLVADTDEYVGRFVAYDYVEVRARVSGYLEGIDFVDGQLVKKGDRLFAIDSKPFEAARDQAQAALAQAKAALELAEADLKRGENLVKGTTITEQTFDQRIAAERGARASVAAQEAALRQAELDLSYSTLVAPISGRIGDRRVSVGNLVTGGSGGSTTLLATIATVDPIRFEFTLDEASYLRYARELDRAKASFDGAGAKISVKLKLIDEKDFVHEGRLDFVDNALDRSTGTIRGRALFNNADGTFTPGMFGRIQIAAAPPAEALLVPDAAIATEQVRKFVYTVGDDNIATPKYVTLGPVVDGMRVITAGLAADDVVVINGLMRVRPGSKVSPEMSTAEVAPEVKAPARAN